MKTLKKSLALVLAVVMALSVLGILAVPASAYTDDDDITNVEAVAVLSAIGAIDGKPGGDFDPTGELSRAEAAGIIARVLLGRSVADLLPLSSGKFTDVASNHWASGYINYCVSMGIINGATATTFNPDGLITDVGFLKLLLGALGYNDNGELTGNLWMVNTLALALKLGLDDGVNVAAFDGTATRDNMAQYAFNTLNYSENTKTVTMYEIISLSSTYTTNSTAVRAANPYETFVAAANAASGVSTSGPYAYNVDYTINTITKTVNTDSIRAKMYKTLANYTNGFDDFGRPSNVWKYGSPAKTIYSSLLYSPVVTYTASFTYGDLYKALGENAAGISVTPNIGTSTTPDATLTAQAGDPTLQGGNGFITEVYKTGPSSYMAVQIAPAFAEVTAVTNVKATATTGAYTYYTISGSGYTATDNKLFTSVVDPDADKTNIVIDGTVAKGDKVLYYRDTDDCLYIQSVGTLEGVLTAVSTVTGNHTIDGKTYKLADYNGANAGTPNAEKQTFYVDSYNNVIDVKGAPPNTVTEFYAFDEYTSLVGGKLAYYVTGVWNDGIVADIRVAASGTTLNAVYTPGAPDPQGIRTLVANTALVPGDAGLTLLANGKVVLLGQIAPGSGGSISSTDRALVKANNGNATNFFANYYASTVKFIYISANGTVTVKEGVQNVPSIPAKSYALAQTKSGSPLITAVFINGDSVAYDPSNLIYIADNTKTGDVLVGGTSRGTYEGYLNGEKIEIPMDSQHTADAFYTFVKDSDGLYTLTAFTPAGSVGTKEDEAISAPIENRLFTVDSVVLDLTGATIIDLRDPADQASEPLTATAAGISAAITAYSTVKVSVIYNSDTDTASIVYITSVSA